MIDVMVVRLGEKSGYGSNMAGIGRPKEWLSKVTIDLDIDLRFICGGTRLLEEDLDYLWNWKMRWWKLEDCLKRKNWGG